MLCLTVIGSSLLFSILKAGVAPITGDEAYTYLFFVRLPLTEIFRDYHLPNNHLFHTLLVKVSTSIFGLTPLAIRAPALVGAAVFLGSLYLIVSTFFRFHNFSWLWLSLVALTPMVVDYNALARGYSLGCGFCYLAIFFLGQLVSQEDLLKPKLTTKGLTLLVFSGILLGAALGCVPVFILVVLPLCISFVYFLVTSAVKLASTKSAIADIVFSLAALLLPLGIVTMFFYHQLQIHPQSFVSGYKTLSMFLRVFWSKLFYLPQALSPLSANTLNILVMFSIILSLWRAWSRGDRISTLMALCFLLSVICLAILRPFFGIFLPFPRAVLFFVPLIYFSLTYALTYALTAVTKKPHQLISVLGYIVLLGFLLRDVSVLSFDRYGTNRRDVGVPEVMSTIEKNLNGRSSVTVSVPSTLRVLFDFQLLLEPRPYLTLIDQGRPDFRVALSARGAKKWPGTVLPLSKKTGLKLLMN